MKIEEAISILKTHNEWRRGADIPMTDVTVLGEAIDCVVKAAEKWERFYEADMLFKKIRQAGIDLKTDIGLAIKKELSYRHEKDIDKACEWIRKYYSFADKEYVDEMIDDFTKHMGTKLEKSEKPTNLTWQDVRKIVNIADEIINDGYKDSHGVLWDEEGYYKAVLKIFNEE